MSTPKFTHSPPTPLPEGFDPVAWGTRAGDLDALRSILPEGRATQLATLLTDEDVATLRHLAETGMGDNSLRALSSDLGYLEAWGRAALGAALPWPAPLDLVLKFIAHHMWDADEKALNPNHGMPPGIADDLRLQGMLRTSGPHAPSTVKRRLSSWSTLHQWRDMEGPFKSPALRKAMRLAVRSSPRGRQRKSKDAISGSVIGAVLAVLDTTIADTASYDTGPQSAAHLSALRDRSVLSLGFASGGRRRSEISGLMCADIIRSEKDWTDGGSVVLLRLGRTKTDDAADDVRVAMSGRATGDLDTWLTKAEITSGPVFRRIDRWGRISERALTPQSINTIVKKRLAEAGYEPASYSAHGLRSGFLTEAFLRGLSLPEAMSQSGHKSANQAASYFQASQSAPGRAARLLD